MHRSLVFVLLLLLSLGVHAEEPERPPATPQSAAAAWKAGDHEEVARQYRELVTQDPSRRGGWYRLGTALLALQRNAEAVDALEQAAVAPQLAASARYNQACALSREADVERALTALEAAVAAGFHDALLMARDVDLEAVRAAPEFAALLRSARERAREVPERQFDFWVGSWVVRNAQGAVVGHNEITLRQKGRVVHEAWANRNGGTGESINFYDAGRGLWRQVWVDDQGGVVEYEGRYEDGALRMQGRKSLANGTTSLARATFHENDDGTVRQHLEQSTDGGRSWSTTFDGLYTRK